MAETTLQKFAADVTKAGQTDLRQKIHKLLKALEMEGQGYAKDHYGDNGLGVVTGALRNSIKFNALTSGHNLGVEGTAGLFGSRVVYAAVHEFGYGGIIARPYIGPAMDHLRKQLGPELKKLFHSSVLGRRFTP